MSISSALKALPISRLWELQETTGVVAALAFGAKEGPGEYKGGFTLGQPGPIVGTSSVKFNGSTGFVGVPPSVVLHPPTWSCGAYVYVETVNGGAGILCSNEFSSLVGYEIGLGIVAGGEHFEGGTYKAGWRKAEGTIPGVGKWYFVAATYDTENIVLYLGEVGGVLAEAGKNTFSALNATYNEKECFIGRRHDGSAKPFFAGRIAFPFMGETVLTKTQLETVFTQGSVSATTAVIFKTSATASEKKQVAGTTKARFADSALLLGGPRAFGGSLALLESFIRAEESPLGSVEPFKAKWGKVSVGETIGKVGTEQNYTGINTFSVNEPSAAYWKEKTYTEPGVSAELFGNPAAERWLALYGCLANVGTASVTGYRVRMEVTVQASKARFIIEKMTAEKTFTVLAESAEQAFVTGNKFGLSVESGIVTAWKNVGLGWVRVDQANDSTYTVGSVGVGARGSAGGVLLRNLEAEGVAAPTLQTVTKLTLKTVGAAAAKVQVGGTAKLRFATSANQQSKATVEAVSKLTLKTTVVPATKQVLAGTTKLRLATTSTAAAVVTLAGTTQLRFQLSSNVSVSNQLKTRIIFQPVATVALTEKRAGTTKLTFKVSASTSTVGEGLQAITKLTFATTAGQSNRQRAEGTAKLTFAAKATVEAKVTLAAKSQLRFATSTTSTAKDTVAGTTKLTFATTANTANHARGNTKLVLQAKASLSTNNTLAGTSQTIFRTKVTIGSATTGKASGEPGVDVPKPEKAGVV